MNYTQLAKESTSKETFAKKLGYKYLNGRISGVLNQIILENSLDTSHFSKSGGHNKKYEFITKNCPVCKTDFVTQQGHKAEKQTCGYSCSNKFFHKRIPVKQYTAICFRYHKRICVVCGEDKIVTVHHYDENHMNNSPDNLIPVCPNHHQYWHSKYKSLVKPKIDKYRKNFVRKQLGVVG